MHIWDLKNRAKLVQYPGHRQRISSLVSSPDGTRLASASADGEVKVWHWEIGRLDRSLDPKIGAVHAVAWSRHGQHLGAAGEGGVIL